MRNTEKSELKRRAMLAKQRMRMGYWKALNEERMRQLEEIGQGTRSMQLIKELQIAKIVRDDRLAFCSTRAAEEEVLYRKVCKMLDENELVSNPIGKLVDKELYDSLDEGGRQKYILDLANKYREMKERYYRERKVQSGQQGG